ncbi:4-hydroxy-tetrahydrodipicolinate synthase [Cuneatibacter sp. NSJ-177]|uniref:4-hydroxy-tetrahydrodipicolinate synthase n=1 Tax=Cuneatibacter sp. NSJ-177 TaxID=2931401 RepID=UPI001FCF9B35|nr:4-hydroxy-tetrahydrodipicolinate synthase [Cuneatibacter sp. NSJ-177]MCJ7835436.1 4-hydroxy-tetrahydrodipicolinate synthase [Cuneatibacter sp. NSJ-177]
MAIFKGAGVAIVTPFKDNYEVNFEKLGELIDFQINNQTDAIIICGTTGESATLSIEEHKEVIRYCIKRVAGRVPVIAGTGSNCTETAIELSRDAEKDGADGLLVVTPYYNKATQKGLVEHYTMIAESVELPIIMYNVPSRTGCNILPATAAEIAKKNKNIVAIKDAVGNLAQTAQTANLAGTDLDIYSGNDDEVLPSLSLGGLGVISVLSNIMPKETHDMVMNYMSGNVEAAREFQLKAIPLINALFCEVNPIPVKTALNLMGMNVGPLRRPMSPMEPQNVERLKKAMADMGLLN